MKKLFILAIIVFFVSCEKDTSTINNDRLIFKSWNDFFDAYKMLSKSMYELKQYEIWANIRSHSTLLNSQDTLFNNFSYAFKTILNKDAEVEIGDSIYWFNNGDIYSFSKRETNISSLKLDITKCKKVSVYGNSLTNFSKKKNFVLGVGSLNAQNQYPFSQHFYQACGGSLVGPYNSARKYIHEIYSEYIQDPYSLVLTSKLHLRVKLEFKNSSGSWRPAGEQREIRINIDGLACLGGTYVTFPITKPIIPIVEKYYDCTSGSMDFTLQVDQIIPTGGTVSWHVSLWGSIYQRVKGDDVTNGWNNTEHPNSPGYLWN